MLKPLCERKCVYIEKQNLCNWSFIPLDESEYVFIYKNKIYVSKVVIILLFSLVKHEKHLEQKKHKI